MKLEPVIMDYCLFQFDALKFFLGVRPHWGPLTLIFFNVNPQILKRIVKFTSETDWKQIFTTFFTLV